jgi:hypothetical protein
MDPKVNLWFQGLRQGHTMLFCSLGGSMVPAIGKGDVVAIVPGGQCRVGDIVLYLRGDGLFLHRVVAKSSQGIVTKGDAVGHLDPPVDPGKILGRAVARTRRGQVRPLDTFSARFLGLSFCLTVSWVPRLMGLLAAGRRLLQATCGVSALETGVCH